PVAEPRLGEAEPGELAVAAVEHPGDDEACHARGHPGYARRTECQAADDADRDSDQRHDVRGERSPEQQASERPREPTVEDAVEIAVVRVLQSAKERALENAGR